MAIIMEIEEGKMQLKEKLNKFFRELRKKGYIANQNFLCCQTCAFAQIQKDHPKIKKVVFYHKQDTPTIKNGFVYISWSGKGTEISDIAKGVGLATIWNGNKDTRIKLVEERGDWK